MVQVTKENIPPSPPVPERKHNHYFKRVSGLEYIDVYRVLSLFEVTDPCIQHAVKKLLVAGGRGAGKDITRDIKEAVDSLVRWQEMRREEHSDATSCKQSDNREELKGNNPSTVLLDEQGFRDRFGVPPISFSGFAKEILRAGCPWITQESPGRDLAIIYVPFGWKLAVKSLAERYFFPIAKIDVRERAEQ